MNTADTVTSRDGVRAAGPLNRLTFAEPSISLEGDVTDR